MVPAVTLPAPPPRPSSRYITDPPSAASTGKPTLGHSILDAAKLRALHQAGKIEGISIELPHPNDQLLIATVVAHGMPRWSAEQMPVHPGLRLAYFQFWVDVQMAADGEKGAKERVDACIDMWQAMRKDELISDRPDMTVGFWER